MVLYRVQRLNRDIAAAKCAMTRLTKDDAEQVYDPGQGPEDIPECKQLVRDLVWKRLVQEQRESKCCCQRGGLCHWTKKSELISKFNMFSLIHGQCPASAPVEAPAEHCGTSPLDGIKKQYFGFD